MTGRRERKRRKSLVHVHAGTDVTIDRVTAFGDADRSEQLQTLAELNRRVTDDATTVELALLGIALAFFAAVLAPRPVMPEVAGAWAWLIIGLIGAGGVLITLSPALVSAAIRSNRRDSAAAWLIAYEDEIARRRGAKGRAARAWRKTH
jgi:hypothetical protein